VLYSCDVFITFIFLSLLPFLTLILTLTPCFLGMIGWGWVWGTVMATVGEMVVMVAMEGGEIAGTGTGTGIGSETGEGDKAETTGDEVSR